MFRLPENGQQIQHLMTIDEMTAILTLVAVETARAENQFQYWPADLNYGDQIVNEEKGEATKALLDIPQGKAVIADVLNEYIQTAAMCVRQIGAIRRFIKEMGVIMNSDGVQRILDRTIPALITQIESEVRAEIRLEVEADLATISATEPDRAIAFSLNGEVAALGPNDVLPEGAEPLNLTDLINIIHVTTHATPDVPPARPVEQLAPVPAPVGEPTPAPAAVEQPPQVSQNTPSSAPVEENPDVGESVPAAVGQDNTASASTADPASVAPPVSSDPPANTSAASDDGDL